MPPDPAPSPLEKAQARLDAALAALEARLGSRAEPAPGANADHEAQRLRRELASAGERERQLEQLAAEASAALGRAAAEVRAALDAET